MIFSDLNKDIYQLNSHVEKGVGVLLLRNPRNLKKVLSNFRHAPECLSDVLIDGIELFKKKLEKMNREKAATETAKALLTRPLLKEAIETTIHKKTKNNEFCAGDTDLKFKTLMTFKNHLKRFFLNANKTDRNSVVISGPDRESFLNSISILIEDGLDYRSLIPETALGYLQVRG